MKEHPVISLSPSFNSYSNSKLAEIADEFYDARERISVNHESDEEESEFAFVTRDNSKIRPVYPVFDRDLLLGHVKFQNKNGVRESISSKGPKVRLSLRKLFVEERESTMTTTSSSSSEADGLDGVAADTYCVWRPKAAAEEDEGLCKKSRSESGDSNSKRWKLRDILHRRHTDVR